MSEREDQNKKTLIPFTRDHFNIQTNMVLTRLIQAMIPVTIDLSSQLDSFDGVCQASEKEIRENPAFASALAQAINNLFATRDFQKEVKHKVVTLKSVF